MIPEYKLYHGAVLAELVHRCDKSILIDELIEEGRLTSYILDNRIGLQIKHSTQRLHPWQFTFTKSNIIELLALQQKYSDVYIAFVCHTDGIACLSVDEVSSVITTGENDQAWIRIDRRKGEWYGVSGGAGELPNKKPNGIDVILQTLTRYAHTRYA